MDNSRDYTKQFTGDLEIKKSRKHRLTALFTMALLGLMAMPSQASLLLNGGFDDGIFASVNVVQRQHLGDGWIARVDATRDWEISGGVAVANNGTFEMVQVNSISGESGSDLKFGFTWTAPSGATGGDLDLNYALVGWIGDTDSDPLDRAFNGMNFGPGLNVRSGIGALAVDLTDGDTTHAGLTVTGTAGSAQTFTSDFDLSGYAADRDDLSDYDHIGIAFWRPSATLNGGTLDDVNFSVIPEPSTSLMLGVGLLTMLGFFRRRRELRHS